MRALDESGQHSGGELRVRDSGTLQTAQSEITSELNRYVRRLRSYQTEGDWVTTVLEMASRFARAVAIFALSEGICVLRSERNLNLPERLSFPLSSAPAFTSAVEANDPVIALRTRSEVGETLSVPSTDGRAHIIPIANGTRVVAVLFAADEETVDMDGIELIAGVASAVLERRSNANLHAQIRAFPSPEQPEAAQQAVSRREL